jgi:hypothetical protein
MTGDAGAVGGLVRPVVSAIMDEGDGGEAVGVLARVFSQGGSLYGSSGEAGFWLSILDGPRKTVKASRHKDKIKREYLFDA